MISKGRQSNLSKFISKILRHSPKEFGVSLDANGFCAVVELLEAIRRQPNWSDIAETDIKEVVRTCPKQRYLIDDNKIRANYGHSAQKTAYAEKRPPDVLYHGTNKGAEDIILREGVKSMGRQYVHLSASTHFAALAGKRRGELSILTVDAKSAFQDGVVFYYAENEVWLSDFVPSKYLSK